MSDKMDLIYDLVKELDRKQEAQTERQIRMEGYIEQNTKDLAEHIEGVKQTRRLIQLTEEKLLKKDEEAHTALNSRLKKLEEPYKVAAILLKWSVKLGAAGGAIYGIYRGILVLKEWYLL